MDEYDNLDTYNGDPVHDGWVNFDYNENTGELSDLFDESDLDQYIDILKDWDKALCRKQEYFMKLKRLA